MLKKVCVLFSAIMSFILLTDGEYAMSRQPQPSGLDRAKQNWNNAVGDKATNMLFPGGRDNVDRPPPRNGNGDNGNGIDL